MTLTEYERGTVFKTNTVYTSGSTYIDCSGNMAYLTVYKPNGDTLLGPVSGLHESTGTYQYFVSTQTTDDLGIYVLEWKAMFNYQAPWNYSWKYDREPIHIVYVK